MSKRKSWRLSDEKGMTPYKLEAILRHYQEFAALYESSGIEEISLDDGTVVNIHDILKGIDELPKRQKTALILTCLYNMKEVDAAPLMGFTKWTSPVSSYKKLALEKLCQKWWGWVPPEEDKDVEKTGTRRRTTAKSKSSKK